MAWAVSAAVLLASSFLTHSEAFFSPGSTVRVVGREALSHTPAKCSSAGRTRAGAKLGATASRSSMSAAAGGEILEGDTVVVVGASGGIGRLVTQSLASTGKYKVKGLVRNLEKAKEALLSSAGGGLEIELEQGDILDESSLVAAMKGAACVVACTGTTAFPSKRWKGGNTPDAVDNLAVGNMLRAAAGGGSLKRFVLLSSVGVTRADKFPFVILNAFGVLDAKAKGEAAVRKAAKEGGFGYSIVRPGQIKGDPFLAYSNSGAALSPDAPEKGSAKRMVSLRQGDSEAGDVNPSSVAEVFTQTVGQTGAIGKSFTVINSLGNVPSQGTWDELFAKL
ncbi:unnamed protein product [Ectocarpus sp. CCAP 1310/34]|nr:unnamed protein product [Ectocarpus sp. CCAP 1310/34]